MKKYNKIKDSLSYMCQMCANEIFRDQIEFVLIRFLKAIFPIYVPT